MKRQDDRPDAPEESPRKSEPANERGKVPLAPFDPPVLNPAVLALLKGLNPSVTPVPMQIATTDGDMSAKFAAGPREAPKAGETPVEQAKVVVSAPRKKAPPDPVRLESTFQTKPRRTSPLLLAGFGLLVVAAGVFWLFLRGKDTPEAVNASPTSSTVSTARSAPPALTAAVTAVPSSPAPEAPALVAPPTSASAPGARSAPQASSTAGSPRRGDIDPGSSPF